MTTPTTTITTIILKHVIRQRPLFAGVLVCIAIAAVALSLFGRSQRPDRAALDRAIQHHLATAAADLHFVRAAQRTAARDSAREQQLKARAHVQRERATRARERADSVAAAATVDSGGRAWFEAYAARDSEALVLRDIAATQDSALAFADRRADALASGLSVAVVRLATGDSLLRETAREHDRGCHVIVTVPCVGRRTFTVLGVIVGLAAGRALR